MGEWVCPNCGKYHSKPHYRNWRDGPLYCPHCGWEDVYIMFNTASAATATNYTGSSANYTVIW